MARARKGAGGQVTPTDDDGDSRRTPMEHDGDVAKMPVRTTMPRRHT
jgi:hypothetical protein